MTFQILANSCHVILVHFEEIASIERQLKPSEAVIGRAKKITNCLRNFKHMAFRFFLVDNLDCLKELFLKFQHHLTALDAITALETHFLQLIDLKTQPGPMLSEFEGNVSEEGEYRGIQLKRNSHFIVLLPD